MNLLQKQKNLKKTSSNKLIREQKRHNRCHSPNVPKGTQINNFITLNPNNSTNQTSISGSNEFTIEDFTSDMNSPREHEHPAKENFSAMNNNSAIAAQPISFPNIAAQEEIPSVAMNQRNNTNHAKNNPLNNSNSTRDYSCHVINNLSSPTNAHCAQYNFPNISNSTQDDTYHAKNNLNGTKTNAQNIPLALHRNSTRDNMPPPVISTEHRSTWKQPSTRNVIFSFQTTAIPSTNQAGTQPRLSGTQPQLTTANSTMLPQQTLADDPLTPRRDIISADQTISTVEPNESIDNISPSVIATEHSSAGKQPNTFYVNLTDYATATPTTSREGTQPRLSDTKPHSTTANSTMQPTSSTIDPTESIAYISPSAITAEHSSTGKQPITCYVNLPDYATATPTTSREGTQPPTQTEHSRAWTQPRSRCDKPSYKLSATAHESHIWKHHAAPAANRNFLHEIKPTVMISAAKSQTCNISIQFPGSCDQSANFLNKRNHNHADDSPHNSHHQCYLITSVHGNNPSQEGLSLVDLSHPPSCIEKAMQQTPIWKANSSPLTQTERLKAVGVSKISKYSDTHTPMGCSLWTCVSLYAHSGRIYPPMLTMYLCIPAVLTTDLCILLCSRQTCTSLCAHYGPVFPPMLTTVTSIYITGHRKPNPHHPTAAHNTTHTTYHTHHTSRMATPPPVVPSHTPTPLLPPPTYIVYTSSRLPPYPKAHSPTSRRQTCARAVSQTTVTAIYPHCSYPDCTQLRPNHHTSLLHARTQIHPYATTNTCHPKPGLCAAKPCTNQHATLCQSCQSTPGTPVYQC